MTTEFSRSRKTLSLAYPPTTQRFALRSSLWLAMLLSGCSLSQEQPKIVIDKLVPTAQEVTNTKPTPKTIQAPLSANTVFRLLAAETLAAKGMPEPAAHVYLDLVQDQPDQAIAQRAYELATQSSDRKLLEMATLANTKANPEFIESWQVQILLALKAGDLDSALRNWQAFFSKSRTSGVSEKEIFLSAATLGQEGIDPDVLGKFGAGIVEQHPNSPMALLMQVVFAVNAERWQTGFDLLWQGLEKHPDQSEIAQLLASMLARQPNDKGISWLLGYTERHPNELSIREQLARALVADKKLEEAKQQFLAIQNIKPSPTIQMSLGLIELELNDPIEAEKWIRPLLEQIALREMASYYLAQALLLQGQKETAIELWSQIRGGDYGLDALIWRTQTLFDLNRKTEAFDSLKNFEPDNDHDYARWIRAQVRLSLLADLSTQAISILDMAIAQKPEMGDLWRDRANLRYDQGDVKGFESDMRHALSINDQDAEAMNALGYFLTDTNRSLAEARNLLEKANQLTPNKHHIIDSLGWLAFHEGKLELAQSLLEQAYQLQADSEILTHWLTTLLAQKALDKARNLATTEGVKYPQDKKLQQLIQQIPKGN